MFMDALPEVSLPMDNKIESEIKIQVMNKLDMSIDVSDEEIRNLIKQEILVKAKGTILPISKRIEIEDHVFNALRGLDVLEDLLNDSEITEIMINGPNNIFIERKGQIEKWDGAFPSEEKLNDVIQHIVADNNKIVNETNPIVDTRLSDGSRVNIVLPPAAVDYSIISIRRFPQEHMTMKRLLEYDSISQEIVEFLGKLVISGYNIFVAGGTGSGKTSFLNALAEFIPLDERVITIEDSAELQLNDIPNLVRLEARDANLEGKNQISIRDLLKSSLRMRPDRVIVGECRGAEALEMLQAFNTGHDGSLSTGHANSNEDMIARLETMVLMGAEIPLVAIRQQIAAGIDIFVHLGRIRDRSRRLLQISEVEGMVDGQVKLHSLYEFDGDMSTKGRIKGRWKKTGELIHTGKLTMSGVSL